MNEQKAIIITGSSRGIGAGIVRHFHAKGDKVVINYSKLKETAEILCSDLSFQSNERNLAVIRADVSIRGSYDLHSSSKKSTFPDFSIHRYFFRRFF
jgi:NAD(P)-dependent dehydrogenase (short-subunit alcohol dehydrogenase family)